MKLAISGIVRTSLLPSLLYLSKERGNPQRADPSGDAIDGNKAQAFFGHLSNLKYRSKMPKNSNCNALLLERGRAKLQPFLD